MKKIAVLLTAILISCTHQEIKHVETAIADTTKAYCANCGQEKNKKIEFMDAYAEETGEKYYAIRIYCSNAKWYNTCDNEYEQGLDTGARWFTKKELNERGLQVIE